MNQAELKKFLEDMTRVFKAMKKKTKKDMLRKTIDEICPMLRDLKLQDLASTKRLVPSDS